MDRPTDDRAAPAPQTPVREAAELCASMLGAVAARWRDRADQNGDGRNDAAEFVERVERAAKVLSGGATGSEDGAPQEDRFHLLVDAVRDYAMFMVNPDGRISSWNAGAQRLKGYTEQEAVGTWFGAFYPPEDQAAGKPQRALQTALDAGRFEEEGWRVRKDGTRFLAHVVITPVFDRAGRHVGFAKVTRDLTESRHARESLRRAEEGFALLVEAVRDYSVFLLDTEGRVTTWNQGAEAMKGYAASEIIGRHFSVFYSEEDRRRGHPENELRIALREGRYAEEGWRFRKDGTRFWASVTITALFDSYRRHVGFAKITRDMTERRNAEEALRRANESLERRVEERTQALLEANREIEAFSYSVSHDLRGPLRALDGFSRLLLERAGDRLDEVERDYLQRIRAASNRMSQLIDGMLMLSSLTRAPLDLRPLDLSELANAVVAELRHAEPERKVTVEIASGLTVQADPRLTRILLENLVRNAWKFTRNRTEAHIEFGRAPGHRGAFFIRDNGAGFDSRRAEKLFTPFVRLHRQREFEGTGIGLATVHRIVRRHGGRVWADGRPGEGATFFFTLNEGHE